MTSIREISGSRYFRFSPPLRDITQHVELLHKEADKWSRIVSSCGSLVVGREFTLKAIRCLDAGKVAATSWLAMTINLNYVPDPNSKIEVMLWEKYLAPEDAEQRHPLYHQTKVLEPAIALWKQRHPEYCIIEELPYFERCCHDGTLMYCVSRMVFFKE